MIALLLCRLMFSIYISNVVRLDKTIFLFIKQWHNQTWMTKIPKLLSSPVSYQFTFTLFWIVDLCNQEEHLLLFAWSELFINLIMKIYVNYLIRKKLGYSSHSTLHNPSLVELAHHGDFIQNQRLLLIEHTWYILWTDF